ncbi:hypothetical protein OTSTA763_1481 [Orientia tsutsugamushi str. TA763]|nr:hypothetical protein OTSTA763_1481 [Orientia tsutsugamushi str. TA763]
MPIIDSLSSACIYRQTKVLSFSSYERHNFQLWSLIRGSVLEKIKSVLKSESIMDNDMHSNRVASVLFIYGYIFC